MRNVRYLLVALLTIILTSTSFAAWSQGSQFSPRELDEILAPIALYPEPLLAQIFPAATYPDQLNAAADATGFQPAPEIIDHQNWDASVKAVAYYPKVLRMLVEKPDWAISIGQAYDQQPNDVMNSIQRLRFRAKAFGYLRTSREQRVYDDNGYLRIVPADSGYIYVPEYDPEVVYVRRGPSDAFMFTAGLVIGVWLNRDIDWHHHDVFYHGWRGTGWVSFYRPRVHITNIYVNNYYESHRVFVSNHIVMQRDTTSFRQQVRSAGPGNFHFAGQIRHPGVDQRFGTPVGHFHQAISTRPVRRNVPGPAGKGPANTGTARHDQHVSGFAHPSGLTRTTDAMKSHATRTNAGSQGSSPKFPGQTKTQGTGSRHGNPTPAGRFGNTTKSVTRSDSGFNRPNERFGGNTHSSPGVSHSNSTFGRSQGHSDRGVRNSSSQSSTRPNRSDSSSRRSNSGGDKSKDRNKDDHNK